MKANHQKALQQKFKKNYFFIELSDFTHEFT